MTRVKFIYIAFLYNYNICWIALIISNDFVVTLHSHTHVSYENNPTFHEELITNSNQTITTFM